MVGAVILQPFEQRGLDLALGRLGPLRAERGQSNAHPRVHGIEHHSHALLGRHAPHALDIILSQRIHAGKLTMALAADIPRTRCPDGQLPRQHRPETRPNRAQNVVRAIGGNGALPAYGVAHVAAGLKHDGHPMMRALLSSEHPGSNRVSHSMALVARRTLRSAAGIRSKHGGRRTPCAATVPVTSSAEFDILFVVRVFKMMREIGSRILGRADDAEFSIDSTEIREGSSWITAAVKRGCDLSAAPAGGARASRAR